MDPLLQRFADRLPRYGEGGFRDDRPVLVTRAPGRLDAFGGIIDYTGGTVCETPVGATLRLAYQRRDDRRLVIGSRGLDAHGLAPEASCDLAVLGADGGPADYAGVRAALGADPATAWMRYAAGAWSVLVGEGLVPRIAHGATLAIESDIPLGGGLSSSAAFEMAVLSALCADLDVRVEPKRLARLGQLVENQVVGAPCGLMDQLTVTLGRADSLLVIRCQPDQILATPHLPDGVRLTAVDTGVKHSVGGGEYTAARCAAFMAHRILIDGLDEDPYGGLLANVKPDDYRRELAARLPASLRGDEFLVRYGETADEATQVDPTVTYQIRAAADHHVLDNERSLAFLLALEAYRYTGDAAHLLAAGELMLQSHASYRDNAGLGADEADRLVELAMAAGPAAGVFGAKITGGGCGGTVALLTDERGATEVPGIVAEYERRVEARARIVSGSVDGVAAFGVREVWP